MTDDKELSVQEKIYNDQLKKQEKIYLENLKIQEKFNKKQENLVKTEDKSVNSKDQQKQPENQLKPKKFSETKHKVKKDIADTYLKSKYGKDDSDSSLGSITSGIIALIVGFIFITILNKLFTTTSDTIAVTSLNTTQNTNDLQLFYTMFPLIGLAFMMVGFAAIIFKLKNSICGKY